MVGIDPFQTGYALLEVMAREFLSQIHGYVYGQLN